MPSSGLWTHAMVVLGLVNGMCAGCSQLSTGTDPSLESTATRLDDARRSIQPSLGANKYELSKPFIESVPKGDNAPLDQVLRRAPNARQAGF
jgi:hypothetical protein